MRRFFPLLPLGMLFATLCASGCGASWLRLPVDAVRAEQGLPPDLLATLATDLWQENSEWRASVPPADAERPQRFRWQHPAGTAAATLVDRGTDLEGMSKSGTDQAWRALAEQDELAGWNAMILWARARPAESSALEPALAWLVLEPPSYAVEAEASAETEPAAEPSWQVISPAMRAAAAEAWCRVLNGRTGAADERMRPALEALAVTDLPLGVRLELFRGLAAAMPPRTLLNLAERTPLQPLRADFPEAPPEVRRAVLEACLISAMTGESAGAGSKSAPVWPERIGQLQWDEDPGVRALFGEFVVLCRPSQAFDVLAGQLQDAAPQVREAALKNLGRLHTPAALEELRRQAVQQEGLGLSAVAAGLAAWGPPELERCLHAREHLVRIAVAQHLGTFQSRESGRLIEELLADPAIQVQAAALEAVTNWPDRLAMPVLLHGLLAGGPRTRKTALAQVALRRGEAVIDFPLYESRPVRETRVAELAVAWGVSPSSQPGLEAGRSTEKNVAASSLRDADIRTQLGVLTQSSQTTAETTAAWERLADVTPADIPLLEEILATAGPAESALLCRELLPRLSPVYAALLEIESSTESRRRAGALALSRTAAEVSLSAAAVRRLRTLLVQEQDAQVWRLVMTAIIQDETDEHVALARLALQQPWTDIQILGCAYAERHPRQEFAVDLLPLISASHAPPGLQVAAIRAAARCQHPLLLAGDPARNLPGLHARLRADHAEVRLAAAAALTAFGDAEGESELTRLSLDDHATVRQQAVTEMGRSGRTRFVEPLIRLAWTEPNIAVRLAALEALNQLVPPADRPAGAEQVRNPEQLVELWTSWWNARQTGSVRMSPPG